MIVAGRVDNIIDEQGNAVPTDLLHGGEHFDHRDRNERRRQMRLLRNITLPWDRMHGIVRELGIRRPVVTS